MPQEHVRPAISRTAVIAVIIGVVGLIPGPVLTLLIRDAARSFVPYLPPFVLPLLALALAGRAMREIAQAEGALGGRPLAVLGRIMGIAGSVLSLLYVVACVAALVRT